MSKFLKKILAAGRLVQGGRLAEATTAIQRALAPGAAKAARGAAASGDPAPAAALAIIDRAPVRERSWIDVGEAAAVEPAVTRPSGSPRFEESSFTCAAGTRSFKLFEPAGIDGSARPLVVMLHGCTQSPDDFAAGTRMNELAEAEGFYVLYPAQAPRSNAHKCWNWFVPADQRRGAGEPALLAGMTRHVMQTHAIDADRIFVAGLSAGGAMAAILAREYPDLFAAAGVHSGIAPGVAHDVASAFTVMKGGPGTAAAWHTPTSASMPLWTAAPAPAASTPGYAKAGLPSAPVIVFHGDADATVAPANGDAVIAAALEGATPTRRDDSQGRASNAARGHRRSVWHAESSSDPARTLAEQWVVQGAPHAWSGGASKGSFTDPSGPDASREMLRFFLAHPRRSESA